MAESENQILHYVNGIRRRWLIAALVTGAALSVLAPVAAGVPYIFQARATLLVDQLSGAITQPGAVGELDGRLQSIRQEALSRQRVIEMVKQFNLYPEMQAGAMNDVISKFQHDVDVRITSSSLAQGNPRAVAFTVAFTGRDAKTVADVANRLALFYVEKNDALRSRGVTRTAGFLRDQLAAVKQRLDAQERNVLQFTSNHAGALTQRMAPSLAQYSQLTTQFQQNTSQQTQLMTRRDDLQSQIATLSTPVAGAAVDTSDPNVRLAAARRELDQLLLKWRENTPQVEAKRAEIVQLEARAKATRGADDDGAAGGSRIATLNSQLAGVNSQLADLQKAQQGLREQISALNKRFEEAPVRDAQFEQINRELVATRDEYDGLLSQYQQALRNERAETSRSGEEFHVLDPALPSPYAAAPNKKALLAAALLVAFGLGLGVVIGLEFLDSSFRSVDELRGFTKVPVLATIPRIVTSRDRVRSILIQGGVLIGAAVVFGFIAVTVFQYARGLESVTRMLVR